MDFKRTQGLKKDSDFRKVYKHGKSFANRNLVMYMLDNKSDSTRVGISVSKKVGNAINRNKVRRRIKESYRLNIVSIYDIFLLTLGNTNLLTIELLSLILLLNSSNTKRIALRLFLSSSLSLAI